VIFYILYLLVFCTQICVLFCNISLIQKKKYQDNVAM